MILDRYEAIKAKQDPFGKVWGIRLLNKENSFWIVCIKNAANQLVPPNNYPRDYLEGSFTRMQAALEVLQTYLNESWDMANEEMKASAQKAERKELRKGLDKNVGTGVLNA